MRFISCIFALLLPPLGMLLWFGSTILTWTVSALWLAGVLVFWLLWAGPGLALCLLASLWAFAAVIFMRPATDSRRIS